MSLKLNGATNGSIELDVPDAIGSDLNVTLPATAGEIVVANTSGDVDLGGLTVSGSAADDSVNIDSSGRLLVGTSSWTTGAIAAFVGNSTVPSGNGVVNIARGQTVATLNNGDALGGLYFSDSAGNTFAEIVSFIDATPGSGDHPGRLVFATTADGASSPTERFRITANGSFTNKTAGIDSINFEGMTIGPGSDGYVIITRDASEPLFLNRLTNDGGLLNFYQDNNLEGNISVSGTTVFFNGAHLSRWSQLASGAERIEILRGSVLSNLDEMCEWGDEDNEQLNRMQVSSVEGDPNVSGVFDTWDDDDDTYINDFYCAMTGDFIIRIAQGTTVQRGDLLMSAGDGTAKPQDDDIIRSKTIAKVTSTNVSCTYDDGSYCVPCVLMAC